MNSLAGIVLIFTVTQSTMMPHLITPDVGHSPVTGYAGCSDCIATMDVTAEVIIVREQLNIKGQ